MTVLAPASAPRSPSPSHSSPRRAASRFLKSPKGLLLVVLGLLVAIAAPTAGVGPVLANVLGALLVAAATDVVLAVWFRDKWIFPSGALLTGLIVAMIISPTETAAVPALTSAIAVASKYLLRTRLSNIFNPAALGLVASYFLFSSGESWWGALTDLPTIAVVLLIALGVFIADRVNKLPMALTFLGAFFGLFTFTAFASEPIRLAEIFRSPDVNAALFLALFMLDDPPTSPTRYPDQLVYGFIAALASYAVFQAFGVVYFLPAGVLVANIWEAVRRLRERSGKESARYANRSIPRSI